MDRSKKIELIERSLGIKHKLKVSQSMRAPETHEDIARNMVAHWELEDELAAIELILADARRANVEEKRKEMLKKGAPLKKKKQINND